MSDAKKNPEKWKAEELRAQRKTRLAQMKSKDGGKKPVRNRNPIARLLVVLILVVALLITGVWTVIRLGIPQRSLTALTVGSQKIRAIELNYYYYTLLQNYSLDPNDSDSQETLKAASGVDGFPTNADYLKDLAAKQLQQNVILADQAAQNGVTLGETELAQIKSYFTSLSSAATSAGETYENYLAATFGTGATEEALQPVLERYLLAYKYADVKKASFTFTDDEIAAAYETAKDSYDVVTYRVFYIASNAASDATDAEETKAMETARNSANEMLGKITDSASFHDLSIEYAAEADKTKYEDDAQTLKENAHKSDITLSAQSTWLFDAARKDGDKTVIESTSGYYVLYFDSRTKPVYQHVAVRHILISAAKSTATEAEIATAKTKAEAILAEYEAGAKTEDAFGELAKANSADSNAAQGGLYSDVAPGDMVAEFNDWCFDKSRKAGDTAIVQTDYGFHVMYYVGEAGEDWALNVASSLQSTAYSNFLTEQEKNYPYTYNALGMRFVH
ncbi:MAG: peptidylprolyl isomerase [Clostridiaceae bacterium]|nr:peptidylprolyl isomerase [Clostridiaceae bacterium]